VIVIARFEAVSCLGGLVRLRIGWKQFDRFPRTSMQERRAYEILDTDFDPCFSRC